jgi:hypothetical protein
MPKTQGTAAEAQFAARIDGVRVRFALKLADKIQQTAAALPRMIENGSGAEDVVANAYRWFHDVSGIAPTIGFEAAGRSARSSDAILVGPYRGAARIVGRGTGATDGKPRISSRHCAG